MPLPIVIIAVILSVFLYINEDKFYAFMTPYTLKVFYLANNIPHDNHIQTDNFDITLSKANWYLGGKIRDKNFMHFQGLPLINSNNESAIASFHLHGDDSYERAKEAILFIFGGEYGESKYKDKPKLCKEFRQSDNETISNFEAEVYYCTLREGGALLKIVQYKNEYFVLEFYQEEKIREYYDEMFKGVKARE